ncbi:hypothetical protein [Trichormus sp. NMC-1]|uniref:hypothetical protein n=1 Tax=Trichormus sp. NMC-1 TaxID=1853259 RepID=UPI0008DBEBA8|nr:hypothetical protein [Trichormus sp. NMC-1]
MKDLKPLLADISPEEASFITGGLSLLDCMQPSGIFFRVPGTDKKYYFGDYNDNPQTNFPGVVWEYRKGKETCGKGYGDTPRFLRELAHKLFR